MGLPEGWSHPALSDLVEIRSGSTPTRSTQEFWGGDIPWAGPADLYDRHISDAPDRLTAAGMEEASPPADPGDVLVVVRSMALAKRLFIAQVRERPVAFNQDIKALKAKEGDLLPDYLPHLLWGSHHVLFGLVDEASHGTKRLRSDVFFAQRLPLPPIEQQRAIASVCGTLDDKIKSNRKLIDTATELLPVLFERCAGSATTTSTVGELGDIVGGGTPRSGEEAFWSPEEVAWVTPKDMTALAGVPVMSSGARSISEAGLKSSSAKLLPEGAVLYTSRATLGLIAIAMAPLATNQGFISIIPKEEFGSVFVYCALKALTPAIIAKANGSTFLEVNKTNFKSIECPIPGGDALSAFRTDAEPLVEMISGLVDESATLTQIRDELLPKLVSGKIRVPLSEDPEEQLGAAVEELAATAEESA